jgi:hypothetical protein
MKTTTVAGTFGSGPADLDRSVPPGPCAHRARVQARWFGVARRRRNAAGSRLRQPNGSTAALRGRVARQRGAAQKAQGDTLCFAKTGDV